MRVVVVGATGNIGSALVSWLAKDDSVTEVVGVARRPAEPGGKVTYVAADITRDDLVPAFRGAGAVVHVAWAIQPSHDLATLRRINVDGSSRVFAAAVEAGVPALVYASSVGAYSPGPKDRLVGESWPTRGIASSFYARHKAEVERLLDVLEAQHPDVRVVRIRPSLTFRRDVGPEVGRLFAGRLLPKVLVRPALIPVVPDVPRLRFQVTHSLDMGRAFHLATVSGDARGAYNVAADPPLDPAALGRILGARPVPVPARLLRGLVDATWRLRLQPTPPGWLDMALATPLMDPSRIRRELGWLPRYAPADALLEVLEGMRTATGAPTPALAARVPVTEDPNTRGPRVARAAARD